MDCLVGKYSWFPVNQKSTCDQLTLYVDCKGANDFHIGLSETANSSYMYEFVIGGWGNTQSVIRRSSQGSPIATAATNAICDASKFTTFKITITFSSKTITVENKQLGVFLNAVDPDMYSCIKFIGFSAWDKQCIYRYPRTTESIKSIYDSGSIGLHQAFAVPSSTTVVTQSNSITTTTTGTASGKQEQLGTNEGLILEPMHGRYMWLSSPVLLPPTKYSKLKVEFEAVAHNDIHVAFMDKAGQDVYEVVIGGWGNTNSVIRYRKQASPVTSSNKVLVTNPKSSDKVTYFVEFNRLTGTLKVGHVVHPSTQRSTATTVIGLQHTNTNRRPSYVGFSTWDSTIIYKNVKLTIE